MFNLHRNLLQKFLSIIQPQADTYVIKLNSIIHYTYVFIDVMIRQNDDVISSTAAILVFRLPIEYSMGK